MSYQILSTSEYLGTKNIADLLYKISEMQQAIETIELIVREITKLMKYQKSNLPEQELAIGLDSGLYNFMIREGLVYYVDFYPPRLRIDPSGKRLNDDCIITDFPQPRNVKHGEHLIKYFYTRNGLLIHCLAHIWAALDSNKFINNKWQTVQHSILERVYQLLVDASMFDAIEYLKTDLSLSNSQFKSLRRRFYQHRDRYLSKSPNGGYNLCDRQIRNNTIRKFYLADKDRGFGFSESEGYKMLKNCRRYYQFIKKTGINVPQTQFKLLYLGSC